MIGSVVPKRQTVYEAEDTTLSASIACVALSQKSSANNHLTLWMLFHKDCIILSTLNWRGKLPMAIQVTAHILTLQKL